MTAEAVPSVAPVTFDAVAELVMPTLCKDCPLLNICAAVELARMERDVIGPEDEMFDAAVEAVAAIEAGAAADLALAGVYKQTIGCDGKRGHAEGCNCGNDGTCGAYSEARFILASNHEDDDEDDDQPGQI